MSWTDEKVEKLRELWKKGHTASQIAEVLGDTTRNAVIGKALRLNLEARAPSRTQEHLHLAIIGRLKEVPHQLLEKLNSSPFY